MPHYQLVNPHIDGTMKTMYKGSTPLRAGTKFWNEFTKHIRGHVSNFNFTLKSSDNELSHFGVNEEEDGTFSINKLDLDIDKKIFDDFKTQIEQQQQGGKSHRSKTSSSSSSDLSSDSSSDTSTYKPRRYRRSGLVYAPVGVFNYIPRVYYGLTANPRIVGVNIPTFVTPVKYGVTQVVVYP